MVEEGELVGRRLALQSGVVYPVLLVWRLGLCFLLLSAIVVVMGVEEENIVEGEGVAASLPQVATSPVVATVVL
jgi:hypothetical protein